MARIPTPSHVTPHPFPFSERRHPWDNPAGFGAKPLPDITEPASVPRLLFRTDGVGLVYQKRINWLYGARKVGKTDVLCLIVRDALEAGLRVLYWDWDNSPRDMAERFIKIGANPRHPRLRYANGMTLNPLAAANAMTRGDLVIIDSATMSGAPTSANDDQFTAWWNHCILPFQQRWLTIVVADHTPKSNGRRQPEGPIGDGKKDRWLTGAGLLVTGTPAGRPDPDFPHRQPTDGSLTITCQSDRPGLIAPPDTPAATIRQRWTGQPGAWEYTITVNPPTSKAATDATQPIIDFYAANPDTSANACCQAVGGTKTHTLALIRGLVNDGTLTTRKGPRRATLHSVNPEWFGTGSP